MALLAELGLLIEDNLGSRAVRAYPFQSRCDTYAARALPRLGVWMMSRQAATGAGNARLLAQAREANVATLLGCIT
ncbi:MAG: hypothetical protein ACXVDN_08900 [Ktedonobacteraceae bacterium]